MNYGDTFFIHQNGQLFDSHLWVVISDPNVDAEAIVVVSLTFVLRCLCFLLVNLSMQRLDGLFSPQSHNDTKIVFCPDITEPTDFYKEVGEGVEYQRTMGCVFTTKTQRHKGAGNK